MTAVRCSTGANGVLLLFLLLALESCDRRPSVAAASARPVHTTIAIGPQPGPDQALDTLHNPYANDTGILTDARRLFVWYNCAGCHGDHGGGGMGPSLRDSTWLYGGSDGDIYASIAEGRANGMPAWGTKLPADQIWQVVTYIQSLRTPNEPEKPR
jgi:cytochrome c oxidase cbb3-type subunit 3